MTYKKIFPEKKRIKTEANNIWRIRCSKLFEQKDEKMKKQEIKKKNMKNKNKNKKKSKKIKKNQKK